jgi:hypothetical protein
MTDFDILGVGEILDHIKRVQEMAIHFNNDSVSSYLEEIGQRLSSQEFFLAVLGLFKRGKSSLINALLCKPILPVGIVPLTSVITRMRFGENTRAVINFKDGRSEEIDPKDIVNYTTEKGNPSNKKNVESADVFVNSEFLKNGVILIDTPGVGSTYSMGTAITYEFLDKVDASIFVLAVDPPISDEEIRLLKDLMKYASRIVFVLNKRDYVGEADLVEAMSFCQRAIAGSLATESSLVTIHPVSAKIGMEGCLEKDESKLGVSKIKDLGILLKEMLSRSKGEIIVSSAANKTSKAIADLRVFMEVEKGSLIMSLERLDVALREFERFLGSIETRKREMFYLLDGKAHEIEEMINSDIEKFRTDNESEVISRVENYAKHCLEVKKMSSRHAAEKVQSFLKQTLIETYASFVSAEDKKASDRFGGFVEGFEEQVNNLVNAVREKASELFGVSVEKRRFSISLALEHRFYYHFDPLFKVDTLFMGQMALMLPSSLFKGILIKRVRESTKEELNKNSGRIRYDYFVSRLDKALLKFKYDLSLALESSVQSVKSALEEGKKMRQKGEVETENRVRELNSAIERLNEIHNDLERLEKTSSIQNTKIST